MGRVPNQTVQEKAWPRNSSRNFPIVTPPPLLNFIGGFGTALKRKIWQANKLTFVIGFMTWHQDLSPLSHFIPNLDRRLIAVGWLSSEHPFSCGEVSGTVFEKLCELLHNPWNPWLTLGSHQCEFCRFTGGALSYYKNNEYTITARSDRNLYVPGSGIIYVAPVSIAHYIDAHEYCPPEEFCDAVMNCPKMRSAAYLKAILDNGGRGLGKVG